MGSFPKEVRSNIRTQDEVDAERRAAIDGQREAVARAICSACDENPRHVGDVSRSAHRWQDYLKAADAAIAVMTTV